MGDTSGVAWLRFRTPGVALAPDEVLRRLGRAGAFKSLRHATVRRGRWEPGSPVGVGALSPGTALCLAGRPVRALRAPELPRVRVLAAALPWREAEARGWRYQHYATRGPLWELEAEGGASSTAELLGWLAGLGSPVLGDVRRGGVLVAGGLRLRAAAAPEPTGWWPDEPPFPAAGAELRISQATRTAMLAGHPWALADADLGDLSGLPAGHRVRLRTRSGADAGLALVEGEGRLAARRWSTTGVAERDVTEPDLSEPDVAARVASALERREALHRQAALPGGSDAYRLIHGEADALPGLVVDRLGPLLRILIQGRAALGLRDEVAEALRAVPGAGLPAGLARIEIVNLRPPERGQVRCATALDAELPLDERGRLVVHEAGLDFEVDPGLAEPLRGRPGVGLFLDQRVNRERVRALAEGGRFANLFAHTGAFSAALLAGGAEAVWSVDLSAAYLSELEANLVRNDLATPAHHSVKLDARRFLERGQGSGRFERFDGLIVDPPTAASAGRRHWSVRRDLEPLLVAACRRLAPGGWMLVTRNDLRRREPLSELVLRAAASADAAVADLREAPAGSDFPRMLHFPEGEPFEGVLLQRR